MLLSYTTLMLRLTTCFGTPGQRDEAIVLRLTGRDDQVVGSIEVGKPDAGAVNLAGERFPDDAPRPC